MTASRPAPEESTPCGFVERLDSLRRAISPYAGRGLAIAFSGGVDSTVLLHCAFQLLGDRCCGVIADSPSLPRGDLELARRTAAAIGVRLEVIRTGELELEEYRRNDAMRCYWCRHTLFERMTGWAREQGLAAIAYGEIVEDRLEDRPGRRAANEFGVISPLAEAGFSKEDVRSYAGQHGLEAAFKPAAACLASRIPKGTRVTRSGLERVERMEQLVGELGFGQLRVRDHGERVRVEVAVEDLERAETYSEQIRSLLQPMGIHAVELAAYRQPTAVRSALEDRK